MIRLGSGATGDVVDRVITIVVRLTGFLRLGLGCWRLFYANPKHVNTLVEADQVVTVDLERGIARGWLENTEENKGSIAETRDSGRTVSCGSPFDPYPVRQKQQT